MIKGVNRKIVEINRTGNDYFEKAILFINPQKLAILLPSRFTNGQKNIWIVCWNLVVNKIG